MTGAAERAAGIAVWALSALPMWTWWTRRLAEPLHADVAALVSLAFFVAVVWRRAGRVAFARSVPAWKWLFAAACLAAFHVSRRYFPPTASGVFAAFAGLAVVLPDETDQGPFPIPLVGLLLVALPTELVADLFLGYPLRVVATSFAAAMLGQVGIPAAANGVALSVGATEVWVDAPCAGVHMLGAGSGLALSLAQYFRFRAMRTVALVGVGLVAVVLGNAVRVAALAFCESEGVALSSAAHAAVGLAALFPGAVLCAVAAVMLARGGAR